MEMAGTTLHKGSLLGSEVAGEPQPGNRHGCTRGRPPPAYHPPVISTLRGSMPLDDNGWKIAIAAFSLVGGWLLAQFTSLVKAWIERRRVKKLLIEELLDLKHESKRLYYFFARELQLAGAGGIGNSAPVGIANPIFKGYYKDALLGLNRQQRMSYQMINSMIDSINADLLELKKLINDIQHRVYNEGVDEKIKKLGTFWQDKVRVGYGNCAALEWHVVYHLSNRKRPDLSPESAAISEYRRFMKEAEEQAEKFVKSGGAIPREKFEQPFADDSPAPNNSSKPTPLRGAT